MRIDNNSPRFDLNLDDATLRPRITESLEEDRVQPHMDDFKPRVRPSLVRAPDISRLEALLASKEMQSAPRPSTSSPAGTGWSPRVGSSDVFAAQRAALGGLEKLQGSLDHVKSTYHQWKSENPTASEPTDGKYTMGQILDGDMSISDQCLHLILMLLHNQPETVDRCLAAAPPSASSAPSAPEAQAPATAAPSSNLLAGLMQTLGPICQIVGPVASILGGVLASPLGPVLLGGAATALGAVFPPALALVPAAAAIAPVAGAVLLGVGGVATGVGGLAKGSSAPVAPAPVALPPAPGAAPDLSGTISAVTGLLNTVGPVASAAGAIAV